MELREIDASALAVLEERERALNNTDLRGITVTAPAVLEEREKAPKSRLREAASMTLFFQRAQEVDKVREFVKSVEWAYLSLMKAKRLQPLSQRVTKPSARKALAQQERYILFSQVGGL